MQIEERKKYIGGSDAAAVLGLSRWKTPLQVWAEKTGQVEPEDISGKVAVKLGVKLEQTVAELFMEDTGKKVCRVNETLFHPEYDFLGANLDRRVIGERAGLEVKTCSAWKAKEWEGEEIPREYIVQCVHYLAVTGWDRWYCAVLIGNQDFKIRIIDRDNELINNMVAKEVDFWNRFVIPKAMPMNVTKDDADTLYQLFPVAEEGSSIALDDKANAIIESIEGLEEDKDGIEATIEQQKNELRSLLQNNETGMTDRYKITWKNQSSRRIDVDRLKRENFSIYEQYAKVSETRVLRFKKLN